MTRRLLLVLLGLLAFPAEAADAPSVVVLAAASLTESLQAAAAAWTAQGHPPVQLSFDASSKLARQIEAGAPADAFFSADTAWMDHLLQAGRIDPSTQRVLLGNSLVVVIPKGAPPLAAVGELAARRRVALAAESVPAGAYGEAALTHLGVWAAVSPNVLRGDNVRTVLSWVARGEADAGLVYATDARVEPRVTVALTLPAASHPPIRYPAAVVRGAAQAGPAADFIGFCGSPAGQAIFTAAGFSQASP